MPQRGATSKVSLRHFGILFSVTSTSTTASIARLTAVASPVATSLTSSVPTAKTSENRLNNAALSRRNSPIRVPAIVSGPTRAGSWLLQALTRSRNDMGLILCSIWEMPLSGRDDLHAHDLSQARGNVVHGLAAEPVHLDVDCQLSSISPRRRALIEARHETAFGKELEHARHHPRFGTGMN